MKSWRFPRRALCAAAVLTGLLAAAPVFAQVYDYGGYVIGARDRGILREFIVNQHDRRCHENETRRIEPCGVASRIVVSFAPGTALPLDVHDEVIPHRVSSRIAQPPHGAAYVYADDNVYLIDVLSRNIIDTVPLGTD